MPTSPITLPTFQAMDPSSYLPRFGNWCGPGWSAGRETTSLTTADLNVGAMVVPGADGTLRASPVDALCKTHDIAYAQAQGASDQASQILNADVNLETGISHLDFSKLSGIEKTYAYAMFDAFKLKIDTVDTVNKGYEDLINSLLGNIKVSDAGADGQTYSDTNGGQVTTTVDASGTVHIAIVQSGVSSTLSGDTSSHSHIDFKGVTNGATTYEEVTDVQGDRTTTASVSGNGLVDHIDNATVTVNGSAKLLGAGDNINASSGSSVTVGGNGQAAADAQTDTVTISGSGGTVNVSDGSRVNVSENGGTVNAGLNDNFGVYGSGGTVISGGQGTNLWFGANGNSGTLDKVTLNGGTVTVVDNSRGDVFDPRGAVYGGANDNFGVYGSGGTTVYANTTDGVWIGGNTKTGLEDILNAGGASVAVVDNSLVSISGNVNGSILAGANDLIGDHSNAPVVGNGDNTTVNIYNDNLTSTFNGANDVTNSFGQNDITLNYGASNQTNQQGALDSVYNHSPNDTYYDYFSSDTAYNDFMSDLAQLNPTIGYVDAPGFAGNRSTISQTFARTLDNLALIERANGNRTGAAAFDRAKAQIQYSLDSGAKSTVTGAMFDHRVITWSLNDNDGKFSGKLGASEEAAVREAFSEWSVASGLVFQEVSGNAKADISLGWARLDTKNSGMVGLTSFETEGGRIKAGVTIQLEDKAENKLIENSNGQLIYDGTDATFTQVLLHEIGHALGLGDSGAPNSIEAYYLGTDNRTISESDAEFIKTLYGDPNGHGAYVSDSLARLIQSMASFAPAEGATAVHPTNVPIVPFSGGPEHLAHSLIWL